MRTCNPTKIDDSLRGRYRFDWIFADKGSSCIPSAAVSLAANWSASGMPVGPGFQARRQFAVLSIVYGSFCVPHTVKRTSRNRVKSGFMRHRGFILFIPLALLIIR